MESVKVGIATRLFISGQQIGSGSTYMDFYASTDDGIADTRAFYEGQGYTIDSLEFGSLPRWSGAERVRPVTVRLQKK
jgi:hypothetical protein